MQLYTTRNNRAPNHNLIYRLAKNQSHSLITSTVIAQIRKKCYLIFFVGAPARQLINWWQPNLSQSFIKLYLHTKFHVNRIKIRHYPQNASPPYKTPVLLSATKNNRVLNLNLVYRLAKNQSHSTIISTIIAGKREKC